MSRSVSVSYVTSSRVRTHLDRLNDGLVGVSTGYMSSIRGCWELLVREAEAASSCVVELSALSTSEGPELAAYLMRHASLPFKHVVVHGPAKGLSADAELELATWISELPNFVEGVVLHPETLRHLAALKPVETRILFENMDPRKSDARTGAELARFFAALPDARFCLDVAHAWLHDPTMTLAHDLLDQFGERLAEVHISSILETGSHVPLKWNDLVSFESVLRRCVGVPWILEAAVAC